MATGAASARVDAAARRYRGAIMRYLLRPPLSLTLKYAAFMMDLAQQTDHMQEVLARAAERASERSKDSQKGEPSGEFRIDRSGEVSLEVVYAATVNLSPGARLATLLRVYQREERSRMQHALSDLRRLGYAQEAVDYYLRFLQLEPKPDPTIKVDLDTFIEHIIRFVDWLGPHTHLVAVCQPTVPTLAAVAVMAEDQHPHQPRSMTLMAGPIDCRINPTEVNNLATAKPMEWFESKLIGVVPLRYKGGMRRVYPGFLQISAFMSMNLDRHKESFRKMYGHYVEGDTVKAHGIKEFYDEYLAMMDLPAEFYLQTVRKVFQEYQLPRGVLEYRGRLVKPEAIRRTALFTVEGERDDVCSIGQTLAAHDLCSKLAPYRKQHHLQASVGHYGVFNGKRWEHQIYPRIRDFIHAFDE